MALPKIDVPVFNLDLPLSKQTVRFRPFLVKEEKILLIAMESEDEKTIIDAVKQIINNCCLDEIDVDTLPILDLEYFFLNLRARSVGENVNLQYKCNNVVNEKPCGNLVKIDINLLEVKPDLSTSIDNNIKLDDGLGIVMKYPDVGILNRYQQETEETFSVDKIIDMIINSVECIYDKETVYHRKDISNQEMIEFIESLPQKQFKMIQDFFESVPKLQKTVKFKCDKCGYDEDIVIEGLQSFFG